MKEKIMDDDEGKGEKGGKGKVKLPDLFEGKSEELEKLFGKERVKEKEEIELKVTDDSGNEVTLRVSKDVFEVWRYGGEFFIRGGAVPRFEDVVGALERFSEVIEEIDTSANREEDPGKRGLLYTVAESIENSVRDAVVSLIMEPKEDTAIMREEFKEKFNWEGMKEDVIALVAKLTGKPVEEVIQAVERLEKGSSRAVEHVTVEVPTLQKVLEKSGVRVKSIKVIGNTSSLGVTFHRTVERGSHTEIRTETMKKVVDTYNTAFSEANVQGGISRDEFNEKISEIAGSVPSETIETMGQKQVETVVKTVVDVVLAETLEGGE